MIQYLHKIHASLSDILASELGLVSSKLERLCESPIEVALGLSLYMLDRIDPSPFNPLCLARQGEDWPPNVRLLIPQYSIEGMRIDFMLRDGPMIKVFIECDGHDFHERTKEQARRDRKRDREIQQLGGPILRFTGSEIFADPVGCASQVFEFIGDLHMTEHLRTRDKD